MNKNFCPFIKDKCRDDCVFHCDLVATERGIYSCLLAIKLQDINGYEHDDLTEILHSIDR